MQPPISAGGQVVCALLILNFFSAKQGYHQVLTTALRLGVCFEDENISTYFVSQHIWPCDWEHEWHVHAQAVTQEKHSCAQALHPGVGARTLKDS